MASYPVEFDEHAGFALLVAVGAVGESGTILQHGAVELAGAFGVVAHLPAVLLDEVLVWDAGVVAHHLLRVIIGCGKTEEDRRDVKFSLLFLNPVVPVGLIALT